MFVVSSNRYLNAPTLCMINHFSSYPRQCKWLSFLECHNTFLVTFLAFPPFVSDDDAHCFVRFLILIMFVHIMCTIYMWMRHVSLFSPGLGIHFCTWFLLPRLGKTISTIIKAAFMTNLLHFLHNMGFQSYLIFWTNVLPVGSTISTSSGKPYVTFILTKTLV